MLPAQAEQTRKKQIDRTYITNYLLAVTTYCVSVNIPRGYLTTPKGIFKNVNWKEKKTRRNVCELKHAGVIEANCADEFHHQQISTT